MFFEEKSIQIFQIILIITTNHLDSGVVDEERIADYKSNREQFCTKGKGADFNNAITQMDEYISNPSVCLIFLLNLNICKAIFQIELNVF